jgi:hypothetical protein
MALISSFLYKYDAAMSYSVEIRSWERGEFQVLEKIDLLCKESPRCRLMSNFLDN